MRAKTNLLLVLSLTALAAAGGWAARSPAPDEPSVAHVVVVALKKHTPESRAEFVKSCHKYLSDHEGTLYFAVGTIAEDLKEPVSDRDFDVVIHLVFETKSAEQKYLTDARHIKFVEENRDKFEKVRVFDSYISKS